MPAVSVTSFRSTWKTPNGLRFEWDRDPAIEPSFLEYRLVIGTDADQVAAGNGVVFDKNKNPELGEFALPHADGVDPVVATIIDGLDPETDYFAMLVVADTSGCEFHSDVIPARTDLPSTGGSVVYFEDTLGTGGFTQPTQLSLTAGCGVGGSACLECSSPECFDEGGFENLRLDHTSPPTDLSSLTRGGFQRAYLEFAIAPDTPTASFWSEVWVRFPGERYFRMHPITFRPSTDYRVVQIPLRAMVSDVGPSLAFDDLAAGVDEVAVGGDWSGGKSVRLDAIGFHW